MKKCLIVGLMIAVFVKNNTALAQQFQNGDFNNISVGCAQSGGGASNWASPDAQFTDIELYNNHQGYWVDLTPCPSLWGNGSYIEQKVILEGNKWYSVSLDLLVVSGWNRYVAEVSIGIFNNETNTLEYLLPKLTQDPGLMSPPDWQRKTSINFFISNTQEYTFRFTGSGSPGINTNPIVDVYPGVGVVGVDNITLNCLSVSNTTALTSSSFIQVIPTIATNQVEVTVVKTDDDREKVIKVIDMYGKEVISRILELDGEVKKTFTLDIDQLGAGMYTISMIGSHAIQNQKFVKAK